MSITFISGTPGGGKTYLAVKEMLSKYYNFNKASGEYEKIKDVTIITNIDDLVLDHVSLDDEIDSLLQVLVDAEFKDNAIASDDTKELFYYDLKTDKVKYFFNYKYQSILKEKYGPIVYIIDECQEYFDNKLNRKKWAREVFLFFEKHRHLGMDIFLITQAVSKLANDIRSLGEKEIRALPRSLSITGEMKYNEYIRGMKANGIPKVERPRREIFSLYKSMDLKETNKIKSPLKRFAITGTICVMVGLSLIYFRFTRRAEKLMMASKADAAEIQKPTKKAGETTRAAVRESFLWIEVSYVVIGNQIKILDPIQNILVSGKQLGKDTDLRFIGNTLQMKVTDHEYALITAMRYGTERTDESESAGSNEEGGRSPLNL